MTNTAFFTCCADQQLHDAAGLRSEDPDDYGQVVDIQRDLHKQEVERAPMEYEYRAISPKGVVVWLLPSPAQGVSDAGALRAAQRFARDQPAVHLERRPVGNWESFDLD